MKVSRSSSLLAALARLASVIWNARPGEELPGSSPGLAAAPAAEVGVAHRAPTRPLRRSLRAALAEGAVAEVFAACASGAVITGWALYLGASPAVIGLLSALPLAAQVASLPAAWLMSGHRRKTTTVIAIGLSRLVFSPLMVLPFVDMTPSAKLTAFVAIVATSTLFGVIGNNAWVAWMGDLVPGRIRGRFFGRRTMVLSIAGTAASLGAAVLLDRAGNAWTGAVLASLTGLATVAGLASMALLLYQTEPAAGGPAPTGALAILRHAFGDRRVRPLVSYQLCWNAAVAISASFFSYHLLANLKTGFLIVACHGIGAASVRIVSAGLWGRIVDRVGARPVLVFCSFGIAAVPMIWFFTTPERLWPIALEATTAGFLWAGHGIAGLALSITLSPAASRPLYLAGFATAGGIGFGVASVLAGQLADLLPPELTLAGRWWTAIHVLFLLSAVGRLAAAYLALRLEDPNARGGVPELVQMLGEQARALARRPAWDFARPITRRWRMIVAEWPGRPRGVDRPYRRSRQRAADRSPSSAR